MAANELQNRCSTAELNRRIGTTCALPFSGSAKGHSAVCFMRRLPCLPCQRLASHDLQRIIRQRPLQRLRLVPRRAHPDIALLISGQDDRHRLGMDRLDDRVRRGGQKAVDLCGPGTGFDFVPRSPLNSVQMPAKADSGRSSLSANQTTSFFLVSGFGSGAYSAKLLTGTRQRFSGFSQPRQCGDDVLRMLVTGGPPSFGGGGMPQRIIVSSRSSLGVADHWRRIIGKHTGHRREVADVAVDDAEQR